VCTLPVTSAIKPEEEIILNNSAGEISLSASAEVVSWPLVDTEA